MRKVVRPYYYNPIDRYNPVAYITKYKILELLLRGGGGSILLYKGAGKKYLDTNTLAKKYGPIKKPSILALN